MESKLYYDDTCKICEKAAAKVKEHVNSVKLCGISKGELPDGITHEAAMEDVHFVSEAGETYRGIDAVIQILRLRKGWHLVATFLDLPGIKHIAGLLYRAIVRNRHSFT